MNTFDPVHFLQIIFFSFK